MSGQGTHARRKPDTPKKRESKEEAAASFSRMIAADKAARRITRAESARLTTERQRKSVAREEVVSEKVLADIEDDAAKQKKKDTIERLYASRRAYKHGVVKVSHMVDKAVDRLTGTEYAVKLNSAQDILAKTYKELSNIDRQIEDELTHDELTAHIDECLEYSEYVQEVKQQILHLQVTYYNQDPHCTVRPSGILVTNKVDEDKAMVKLPPLEPQTFSGDYREWAMFVDSFESIIGQRRLDDTNKLSYLKKMLRGDAKASIFRIGTNVSGGYQRARDVLEERYGNTRLIGRAYCHSIVTHPNVKSSDGPGLRALVTAVTDALEGLTQLGVDTRTWDCILVYHVLTKLDIETNRDYNMKYPGRDIPDLDILLKYLSDRAIANEDTACDRPTFASGSGDKKKKTNKTGNSNALAAANPQAGGGGKAKVPGQKFNAAKKPYAKDGKEKKPTSPCLKCKALHALYKCPEFDAMTRAQRNEFCRTASVCFNCLRTGHSSKECKSTFTCNICNGKHHTLLHKHEGGGGNSGQGSTNLLVKNSDQVKNLIPDDFSNLGDTDVLTSEEIEVTSGSEEGNVYATVQNRLTGVTAGTKHDPKVARAKISLTASKPGKGKVSAKSESISSDMAQARGTNVIQLPKSLCLSPLAAVGLGQTNDGRTAILGTVMIPTRAKTSNFTGQGRALLDNCSQINFVSSRFAKKMQLSVKPSKFSISTVGCSTPQTTSGVVSFEIPLPNRNVIPVHAYVFTQVTSNMPSCLLDESRVEELSKYDLGDPDFAVPRAVDMLLGVEVFEELLTGSRRRDGRVTLTSTHFGHVITGSMPVRNSGLAAATLVDPFTCNMVILDNTEVAPVKSDVARADSGSTSLSVTKTAIKAEATQSERWDKIRSDMLARDKNDTTVDDDIRTFWEINDIKDFSVLAKKPCHYTEEERFALKFFDDTTTVDDEGYYLVRFPFVPVELTGQVRRLGSSRNAAVRMLQVIHKKFAKDKNYEKGYREFIQELLDQGHVEEIDEREVFRLPDHKKYYLPHHAVEKESTTTKLRIVMNASAKSSTKWSLNDLLAVGPKLQDDLICHLIRAGFHRIFITGDVSKMYRTLKLVDEETYFCLYLWQESPTTPIRCFRFIRVTYGIASSGHQAVYAMQTTANKHGVSPEVTAAINRDMYVDDFMGGADTRAEAVKLLHGIVTTLWHNKLLMRKWASNDPTIIQQLDPKLKENVEAFDLKDPHHMVKTLGQAWNVMGDYFFYRVLHIEFTDEELKCLTKRELLGDILKLFDPMGWLSPVTLKLKQFMQATWAQGITWEQQLPQDITENFLIWRRELIELRKIKKARCLLSVGKTDLVQLHVFCDASEIGYAACIYARVVDVDGKTNVNLLFAKAKVSPVKQVSIPRLELLAATLGAKVLTIALQSLSSLPITIDQVFAYSDSTTVLAWLSKPSKTWATFVANRVSEIQTQIRRPQWFHVKSEDNPADVASRGLYPVDLVSCSLWWEGPCWLGAEFTIPDQTHLKDQTIQEEKKSQSTTSSFVGNVLINTSEELLDVTLPAVIPDLFQDLNKSSSFERTVRVTVHIFRFLSGFKSHRPKVVQSFVDQCRTEPEVSQDASPSCNAMITRSKQVARSTSEVARSTSEIARSTSKVARSNSKATRSKSNVARSGSKSGKAKVAKKRLLIYPLTKPPSKYSLMLIDPKGREVLCPSPVEAEFVRAVFIRREQQQAFSKEILALQANKPCPKRSKLIALYPFIDKDGVVKVGGRLAQSEELTDQQKFQAIIPKESPLALLLVAQAHKVLLHGTVQGCLAALRQRYWIISVKSLIKKVIRDCISCFRFMCKSTPPLMGDLPRERVTPSAAFEYTGVDFGGPFMIKASGRSGSEKSYIAMFVCFASKAVHIELVGSLSAPACIGAFTRFTYRRGRPKKMYSDNGTNFVGSRNELERLQKTLKRTGSGTLPAAVAKEGVSWVHIPPRAPNFGGLWESAIKSAKYHLKRIVGDKILSREELETVLAMVEGIMNSRPLVELSSDDCDFAVLTPAMLVMAKQIEHLPLAGAKSSDIPPIPTEEKVYAKKRWEHMSVLAAHFWARWVKEYLPTLQVRKKWQTVGPVYKVGELVLLSEDNTKPLHWPLARVLKVFPGNDGVPRVAEVKTASGFHYTRPVSKLRRLPMQTE